MFVFRTTDVVLIAVMLSAAAFTYKTKHDAEAMMRRVSELETGIQLEKDAINVLKADWSLLTQPGRLETLTEIYKDELGLAVLDPRQIAQPHALGAIPLRDDLLVAEDGQAASDPVVTGGVHP